MPISPITPSSSGPPPHWDPIVQRFNDLWNDWYNHPTRKTAEALLDFMKKNHDHFEELAKHCPPPQPIVDFDHAYQAAINTVQNWIDHGCDPHATTAPSEFVADVAKWINYAR